MFVLRRAEGLEEVGLGRAFWSFCVERERGRGRSEKGGRELKEWRRKGRKGKLGRDEKLVGSRYCGCRKGVRIAHWRKKRHREHKRIEAFWGSAAREEDCESRLTSIRVLTPKRLTFMVEKNGGVRSSFYHGLDCMGSPKVIPDRTILALYYRALHSFWRHSFSTFGMHG